MTRPLFSSSIVATGDGQHATNATTHLPPSPDKTPTLDVSANGDGIDSRAAFAGTHKAIAPASHPTAPKWLPGPQDASRASPQRTPDSPDSGSRWSGGDGQALSAPGMNNQSPRINIELWGRGFLDISFDPAINGVCPSTTADGLAIQHADVDPAREGRDPAGRWQRHPCTDYGGLGPQHRPTAEICSPNEMASRRKLNDRRRHVNQWLKRSGNAPSSSVSHSQVMQLKKPHVVVSDENDGVSQREIALGDQTENKWVPGQTYYQEEGGEMTRQDLDLMRQDHRWADPPVLFHISRASTHCQPKTSQLAIERFERMCRDNDSVISSAATWGTRRRSLPSVSDVEGVISGKILKKLCISRDCRPGNLFRELRGLVRKPSSNNVKRSRTDENESPPSTVAPSQRRESGGNRAPASRTHSWSKNKTPVPSINTALVAIAGNMASIATTHARRGSLSAASITFPSPKSASNFGLNVKKPLRIRSISDLGSRSPNANSAGSSLADIWKKRGGPPVAALGGKASPAPEPVDDDDDDDEDDDDEDESDIKGDADRMLENMSPIFTAFQQHVLKLNPDLAHTNKHLVNRIAQQQIVRYKGLLSLRAKHLQALATKSCLCGEMCASLGGAANVADSKGDTGSRYDGSDGDANLLERVISQESFPQNIPMPPTSTLPAEFECQLCFQPKKFVKPSDWTKHVHEDVQPFTCTWDHCRDPKIFKRKADWVRHENEGHRHLEWWTCDLEDCRHVCYRRDNFLQHLVREHKFPEPKFKTKAAIKRAGGLDPTWQKVETCHQETKLHPQQEPCRFCGKRFPTWKKLTVHLAKHMEQISLPVLRLVARRSLDANTVISPVQDPPPQTFSSTFPDLGPGTSSVSTKHEASYGPPPTSSGALGLQHSPMALPLAAQVQPHARFAPYPVVPSNALYQHPMCSQYDASIPQGMGTASIPIGNIGQAYTTDTYTGLAASLGTYMTPNQYISPTPNFGPLPAMTMDALGLQKDVGQAQYSAMMNQPNQQQHYGPRTPVAPIFQSLNQGQDFFTQ